MGSLVRITRLVGNKKAKLQTVFFLILSKVTKGY